MERKETTPAEVKQVGTRSWNLTMASIPELKGRIWRKWVGRVFGENN